MTASMNRVKAEGLSCAPSSISNSSELKSRGVAESRVAAPMTTWTRSVPGGPGLAEAATNARERAELVLGLPPKSEPVSSDEAEGAWSWQARSGSEGVSAAGVGFEWTKPAGQSNEQVRRAPNSCTRRQKGPVPNRGATDARAGSTGPKVIWGAGPQRWTLFT